jgi:hypothetical protein
LIGVDAAQHARPRSFAAAEQGEDQHQAGEQHKYD